MFDHRFFIKNCIIFIISIGFISSQEYPPKFPDVFQVEVQGIFLDEKIEVDGSLYYDKLNNRAVLAYTYQNESTVSIYNFNDNQLTYIEGVECSVSNITRETFFKYNVDEKTGKKTIGSPEEIFFFTNSVLDRQEISIFPSYVYTAKMDIPLYGLKNCDLTHIFSKPELEMPDCDGHACRSTLVSISVKCPAPEEDEEQPDIYHIYNFFRFRFNIKDDSIFQPPVGVHCEVVSQKPFPDFPEYFSFTYDLIEEQKDSDSAGVYTIHKKVYYDTKLRLIRMDEFDQEGHLQSSRIFDFYGQVAYTIVASIPVCQPGDLDQNVALNEMTRLPKIFFAKKPEDKKDAVYIGKRSVHGLDFEVWTLSIIDEETEAKIVQEFYFTNNIQKGLSESKSNYIQFSHAEIYTYEKDDSTGVYDLSLQTYLSVSNLRSTPKEWEAFDISSCFKGEQKKRFRLKVEGPPVVKNSLLYEAILEKLYMKLIILTNASVIRISQLKGEFDGIYISEFNGWILSKVERPGVNDKEPNMNETYNMIEKAASDGKLNVKVKKGDQDQIYNITALIPSEPGTCIPPTDESQKDCIPGGTSALIYTVVGLILLFMSIIFVIYYKFLRKNTIREDKLELHNVID